MPVPPLGPGKASLNNNRAGPLAVGYWEKEQAASQFVRDRKQPQVRASARFCDNFCGDSGRFLTWLYFAPARRMGDVP
jgi:hypothetical protein